MSEQRGYSALRSPEFILVVVLVAALLISMIMIFTLVTGNDATEIQTGRKDLLAILLGAFGAWIGAGAAYFFGRENLRAATDSMLKMRGISPEERLILTNLKAMSPQRLPKTFTETDTIECLLSWFDEDQARFFAVILNDQGRVRCVLDEEAIYRYLRDEVTPKNGNVKTFSDVIKDQVGKIIEFIKGEISSLEKQNKFEAAKATQTLIDAAVLLSEDSTAWSASEAMEKERKFVTVILDKKGIPTGYVTTGDIRRLLISQDRCPSLD